MFAECRKCYFRDSNLKKFPVGGIPPYPLANSCLRHSPRTSHTILGGGQGKWPPWQFCPTTEESLKNALSQLVLALNLIVPTISDRDISHQDKDLGPHCKFQGVKIAPKYGVTCLSNERPDFFGRFLPLSNGVIFTPLLRSNFYPI